MRLKCASLVLNVYGYSLVLYGMPMRAHLEMLSSMHAQVLKCYSLVSWVANEEGVGI